MTTNARPAQRPPAALALLQRRRASGLSQQAAARALGVSQALIAHIETGRWVPPDDRLAELLAGYDAADLGRGS